MRVNDAAAEEESNPPTLDPVGNRFFSPMPMIEYSRQLARLHAKPLVANANDDVAGVIGSFNEDVDRRPRRRVLHGVGQNVPQNLADPIRIPIPTGVDVRRNIDSYSAGNLIAESVYCLIEQLNQIRFSGLQAKLAEGDPCRVDLEIDNLAQAVDFAADPARSAASALKVWITTLKLTLHNLGPAFEGGDWLTKLVDDRRQCVLP